MKPALAPTTPRVSVLMPVRDAAPWLAEAIASIVEQTEQDWELIAVDDHSRDASPAILERWARRDPRVRIVHLARRDTHVEMAKLAPRETHVETAGLVPCAHVETASLAPPQSGIVVALNAALAAARAPLVARMDADDLAEPERLAAQAAVLEARFDLFAVSCRAVAFPSANVRDGMRRYLAWQNGLLSAGAIARERFVESPLLHPSVTMRTAVLRDVLGGWCDHGWAEDWDLFLRAFEVGLAVERLPRVLLRWRAHGAQATRVDPRYSAERLLAARAHFLSRALRSCGRPAWMLGAGPVGKALARALVREGTDVAGFADVDARKIGGRVRDGERRLPVVSMQELAAMRPRPLAIAAVGRPGARARIRRLLGALGWEESRDWFAAA